MTSFSKFPGGTIRPARFVILGTDNRVTESGANGDVWGISTSAVRNSSLVGLDDGNAGIAGDPPMNIFGPDNDSARLELGGTVTIGQKIRSGAAGVGIAATADRDQIGAIAQESGVSGDLIWVKPIRYDRSTA